MYLGKFCDTPDIPVYLSILLCTCSRYHVGAYHKLVVHLQSIDTQSKNFKFDHQHLTQVMLS